MMLQRVADLLGRLTHQEAERITLEAHVSLLERAPEKFDALFALAVSARTAASRSGSG